MPSKTRRLRIVRIRCHYARQGGKYLYMHADVLAPSVTAAVKAAAEDRVRNWRLVDDFNPGQPETFHFYEVLFEDWPADLATGVREPLPDDPTHRWDKLRTDEKFGLKVFYPKTRDLALEAKLKRQQKLADVLATATSAQGTVVRSSDGTDAEFLDEFANAFREEQGLTRHRRAHCERFAFDLFKLMRFSLKQLPKRERTKTGLAELVQRFQELQAEASSERVKPLDVLEAQLQTELVVLPEFQRRVVKAVRALG